MAAGLLLVPLARGEHLPDHRYFIQGQVTGEGGIPLCGVMVRASDVTQPSPDSDRTAETDGNGLYLISLHMHDAFDLELGSPRVVHNVGDSIIVTLEVTGLTHEVVAENNSVNPDGWGQQTVDFLLIHGLRGECAALRGPTTFPTSIGALGAVAASLAAAASVFLILARDRRKDKRLPP